MTDLQAYQEPGLMVEKVKREIRDLLDRSGHLEQQDLRGLVVPRDRKVPRENEAKEQAIQVPRELEGPKEIKEILRQHPPVQ